MNTLMLFRSMALSALILVMHLVRGVAGLLLGVHTLVQEVAETRTRARIQ